MMEDFFQSLKLQDSSKNCSQNQQIAIQNTKDSNIKSKKNNIGVHFSSEDSFIQNDNTGSQNELFQIKNQITINKNKHQNKEIHKLLDFDDICDNEYYQNQQYNIQELDMQIDQQEQTQVQFQKTLFMNDNTIVQYEFKQDINSLVINKKQNLSEQDLLNKGSHNNDLFEKECKILQLLKGHNITLDIIFLNNNNNSFQQICGKTNLYTLHQKTKDRHVFEVYFLLLLDKLNRMHELGIAHSDIKPQNIVISYNDEPYFIDFDASVYLSDHANYLKCYTYNYNLNVYLKKSIIKNKKCIKVKDFNSQEEIKLCDQTQLAITFLYLLCNNQKQITLFYRKDFNELIQLLSEKDSVNREIVLSIISRILNKADPTIQIIEECNQRPFVIDHSIIHKQLKDSNDIVFINGEQIKDDKNKMFSDFAHFEEKSAQKQESVYKVKRIDQFSINLLYLLDEMCCKIEIIPNEIIIIPLPQKKEFQHIFKKYKQIEQYYNELINFRDLSNKDVKNLVQYINVILRNGCCNIYLNMPKYFEVIFQSIKNSQHAKSIEFNFQFNIMYLRKFIQAMRSQLPEYKIERIKYHGKRIICKIIRGSNENQQLINAQFDFLKIDHIKAKLKVFFNSLKIQQIKQININFLNNYDSENFASKLKNQLKYVQYLVKQMKRKNRFQLNIQIKGYNLLQKYHLNQIQVYKKNLNQMKKKKIGFKGMREKYCVEYLTEDIKEQSKYNSNENSICYLLKKIQCKEIQNTACKILSKGMKTEQQYQPKLILQFYNFLFIETQMWKQLIQNLKQQNKQIEIILVNCQFDSNVAQLLKGIYQNYSKAEFQYHNEYSLYSEDQNLIKLGYQFDIQYDQQQLSEKILNIKFYSQFSQNNNRTDLINEKENKLIKNDCEIFDCLDNLFDINSNDAIQNFLSEPKSHRNYILYEVKIPDDEQNNIQIISSKNKKATQIKNIEELDFIIDEINKKNHYKKIEIEILQKTFNYIEIEDLVTDKLYPSIEIKFNCDIKENDEERYILVKYQQLFIYILNNYNNYTCQNYYFNISLIKKYESLTINQNIISDKDKQLKIYLKKDELKYPFKLQYQFILKEDLNKLKPDILNEDIKYSLIIEQLKNFQQQQYFINQEVQKIFENQDYVQEFDFSSSNIGDKSFKQLFLDIENLFIYNRKQYILNSCGLTKQTLFNIYEMVNTKQVQTIKFNLMHNYIEQQDLKQFIQQIIQDKSYHHFIFKIQYFNQKIKQFFENEFKDDIQFKEKNNIITLKYKPKLQQEIQSEVIIILYFDSMQIDLNEKKFDINQLLKELFQNDKKQNQRKDKKVQDKGNNNSSVDNHDNQNEDNENDDYESFDDDESDENSNNDDESSNYKNDDDHDIDIDSASDSDKNIKNHSDDDEDKNNDEEDENNEDDFITENSDEFQSESESAIDIKKQFKFGDVRKQLTKDNLKQYKNAQCDKRSSKSSQSDESQIRISPQESEVFNDSYDSDVSCHLQNIQMTYKNQIHCENLQMKYENFIPHEKFSVKIPHRAHEFYNQIESFMDKQIISPNLLKLYDIQSYIENNN